MGQPAHDEALFGSSDALSLSWSLESDMQQIIDQISSVTGYAISVGYVDKTLDIGIGSGPRDPVTYPTQIGGTTAGNDTMLLALARNLSLQPQF